MLEADESHQELMKQHKKEVSGKFFNEADLNKFRTNPTGQAMVKKVTKQKIKGLKQGEG